MRLAKTTVLALVLERHYFPLNLRVRCEQTRKQYRYAASNLSEFLGKPATIADLSDDTVTRLMTWLRDSKGLHPRTVNDRRWRLNALWTWLAKRGVTKLWPTNCAMQVPERIPRAYRREELERLVQAAKMQTGEICGLPASDWWLDLLGIIWDSGMRCSELLAIRWEWLDLESGWIVVPAEVRKGRKKDEAYCLMPDCLERLRRRAQRRGLILQWNMHYTRIYQLWRKLLATANLPANRYTLTQCMRRSFASHLTAGGGNATEALGHGSAAVTRRAYLDRTITAKPHGDKMPFRLL